jgi:hypothetical protein
MEENEDFAGFIHDTLLTTFDDRCLKQLNCAWFAKSFRTRYLVLITDRNEAMAKADVRPNGV